MIRPQPAAELGLAQAVEVINVSCQHSAPAHPTLRVEQIFRSKAERPWGGGNAFLPGWPSSSAEGFELGEGSIRAVESALCSS